MLESMVNRTGKWVKTEKSTPIEAVTVPIFEKVIYFLDRELFK
jgi:hypothetical protein